MMSGHPSEGDPHDYFGTLNAFDDQLHDALALARTAISEIEKLGHWPETHMVRSIVICGMGGSAIAGDIVRNLLQAQSPVPILICRDYHLPHFVDASTLIIASSYSGNTEETVSALRQAVKTGARIVTLGTGGAIAELGASHALYHWPIPHGLQPRQSIGYSLTALYMLLRHVLFHETGTQDMESSIRRVAEMKSTMLLAPANTTLVETAQRLSRHPVIAYASESRFSAAQRFKGQVCENAKMLAFANAIPEMNHNELVGWEMARRESSQKFGVVFFRDVDDHPQVQKRFEIVRRLIEPYADIAEYTMKDGSPFVRLVSAVFWGDCLSYHMAMARRVDPTPVDIITTLKQELARP